ncbi:MAG: hypothetical protein DSY33_00860 [Archaeoglobus sp.]|nr:MAG: hypothetical protein DSY33_00860 [Archaeoglobus sp.]
MFLAENYSKDKVYISKPKHEMENMKIKAIRRVFQIIFLFVVPVSLIYWREFLLYFLIASLLLSVVVGRAFCSWVCPLGTIYEFSGIALKKEKPRYHCRVGCPFSLPIGLMNRVSLLKIQKNEDVCKHCNICSIRCPVGILDISVNSNPSTMYACIRCLTCVDSCPNGALSLIIG